MIASLLILLTAQSAPAMGMERAAQAQKPMATQSDARHGEVRQKKLRMVADGRALLARASQVEAAYSPAEGQPTKAELKASIDGVKSDVDSISEMGEAESLRLQQAMDRLSQMMAMLSSILKKVSDTQGSITNNLK